MEEVETLTNGVGRFEDDLHQIFPFLPNKTGLAVTSFYYQFLVHVRDMSTVTRLFRLAEECRERHSNGICTPSNPTGTSKRGITCRRMMGRWLLESHLIPSRLAPTDTQPTSGGSSSGFSDLDGARGKSDRKRRKALSSSNGASKKKSCGNSAGPSPDDDEEVQSRLAASQRFLRKVRESHDLVTTTETCNFLSSPATKIPLLFPCLILHHK